MSFRTMARLATLTGALFLVGCSADTDRAHYAAGDPGLSTFVNASPEVAYLAGCNAFIAQKLDHGVWTDGPPEVQCVWEGFAQPVAPGEERAFSFTAPDEPGRWRLHYPVGLGCDPQEPLRDDSCWTIQPVVTRPFSVVGVCAEWECGPQLGMPNRLCADGVHFAGPTGRCLHTLEGDACGWEIASCPHED